MDRDLVQEYLNLKPEFKNKFYKAPISHFLRTNKYPYRKMKLKQDLILRIISCFKSFGTTYNLQIKLRLSKYFSITEKLKFKIFCN